MEEIRKTVKDYDDEANRRVNRAPLVYLICTTLSLICCFVLGAFFGHFLKSVGFNGITYHAPDKALIESGFYPGRISGDYSDTVFNFDAYFDNIGAKSVQRYIFQRGEGTVQELCFELDDTNYKVETTIYDADSCMFGLYSKLEVGNDCVKYCIPTNNSGAFILDSNSPIMMDQTIFDVLHNVTDKNSTIRKTNASKFEENGCPFRGLGIAHYEKWEDGEVIWHDDYGEPVNLHY